MVFSPFVAGTEAARAFLRMVSNRNAVNANVKVSYEVLGKVAEPGRIEISWEDNSKLSIASDGKPLTDIVDLVEGHRRKVQWQLSTAVREWRAPLAATTAAAAASSLPRAVCACVYALIVVLLYSSLQSYVHVNSL